MDTNQEIFDVTIVGAGAVGSALALQLHHQGLRVCLIEARTPVYGTSDPERVVALSYGSRCHLHALGVWDQVEASGVGRIEHIDVFESGNAGSVSMNAANTTDHLQKPIDALGYVLEIVQVVEPLHQRIQATDIAWLCPASLQSINESADTVTLNLSIDGKTSSIQTRLLVGADGTHSFIRRLAKISTHGWDQNRFGLVASVACERGHQNVAYECFQSSGPLAFLPLADGRCSIVWAVEPAQVMRLLNLPQIAFLKKLERAAGAETLARLGRMQSIGKRAVFPLELNVAAAYAKGRIALVGNAAHTMHPVAGQGMNLGFRDVLVLAEVLNCELAKNDAGSQILMQSYAEGRRADVLAVAGFTETTLESFTHTLMPSRWLRARAMEAMQQLPMLRNPLLLHASGLAQLQHLKLPDLQARE